MRLRSQARVPRQTRGVAHRILVGALIALIALGMTAAALAAHPHKGAHFKGTTSQGKAISFLVANTDNRIRDPHFFLITSCSKGGNAAWRNGGPAPAHIHSSIKPNGKFSWQMVVPKYHYKGGYTSSGTLTLQGEFHTATTASGTMKGTAHYYPTRKYPSADTCAGKTSLTVTS